MTSEDEYRQVVDGAIRKGKNMPISNGRPEHAVYLIQKMLEHAEEVVRIFSGTLIRKLDGVSAYEDDQILDAAQKFLARGGKMKVLIERAIDVDKDQNWTDHPLVGVGRSAPPGSGLFEIKQVPEEQLKELSEAKILYHWITMDEQAYRLEMDTKKARAIANFGNPETALALIVVFDDLFAKATPLPS